MADDTVDDGRSTTSSGSDFSLSSFDISEDEATDYDTDQDDLKNPPIERSRKVLACYEWDKQCSRCFQQEFVVCAIRVEKDPSREVICSVLGNNPMKAYAQKKGVSFGRVGLSPGNSQTYLGRACPKCNCGQGDYELMEILEEKDMEWLNLHRIATVSLPKWSSMFK